MGDLKPFVRIDEWHRDPKDAYVYAEDGNIKINLDKCIPNSIERKVKNHEHIGEKMNKEQQTSQRLI